MLLWQRQFPGGDSRGMRGPGPVTHRPAAAAERSRLDLSLFLGHVCFSLSPPLPSSHRDTQAPPTWRVGEGVRQGGGGGGGLPHYTAKTQRGAGPPSQEERGWHPTQVRSRSPQQDQPPCPGCQQTLPRVGPAPGRVFPYPCLADLTLVVEG